MNEATWSSEAYHPQGMLWTLSKQFKVARTKAGRRKLRLFAIACCHVVRNKLPDEKLWWENVELAERFIAGEASKEELTKGWESTRQQWFARGSRSVSNTRQVQEQVAVAMATEVTTPEAFSAAIAQTVHEVALAGYREGNKVGDTILCDLIREVFGNPFSPVTLERGFRTQSVASMAKAIDKNKTFEDMPILADALEDAGCDNEEILEHCRSGASHVQGCWALELVLARE